MLALIALLFSPPVPTEAERWMPEHDQLVRESQGDFCDPIETVKPETVRPTYTWKQRKETYRRVRAECRRLGAPATACTVAVAVAVRESSGRAGVRHRLPADSIAARRAYVRYAHHYGWLVVGDGEGNLKARPDASAADHNPSYGDFERWATGLGAMGHQVAVHLWRVSPMLDPEWLCVPENATRLQLGIWYRAVHAYGATSWTEANAVAAGSVEANRPKARPEMDRLFCERLDRWGLDCSDEPRLGAFEP